MTPSSKEDKEFFGDMPTLSSSTLGLKTATPQYPHCPPPSSLVRAASPPDRSSPMAIPAGGGVDKKRLSRTSGVTSLSRAVQIFLFLFFSFLFFFKKSESSSNYYFSF